MHCALCGVYWNQGAAIGWKGWMVAADKGNILIANKEFTLTHQTNDREFGHKYKWKYKYKYMWPDKENILIAKNYLLSPNHWELDISTAMQLHPLIRI